MNHDELEPQPPQPVPRWRGPFKEQESLDEPRYDVSSRGALGRFDVFALIVNKMVGTGIYTAPATVFLMTGRKILTLFLFFIGFLYTLVSMIIYLDYAKVLPFNGGELIYLDEITSHVSSENIESIATPIEEPDIPLQNMGSVRPSPDCAPEEAGPAPRRPASRTGDGLLAFVIYSISFIVFFNSGTNSLQFGRMVLLCIDAGKTVNMTITNATITNMTLISTNINDEDMSSANITSGYITNATIGMDNNGPDVNHDLMRFIGIFILSVICLLQYFSPNFGRSLNKTLAVIKILSLVGLCIAGVHGMDEPGDWLERHEPKTPSNWAFAKALLAVLFSFEGWENATFVTGEIPQHKHHILRHGFITAVWTVGILYLLIVAFFLNSVSWEDIYNSDRDGNVNYPSILTGDGPTSTRAWAVMAALSSFGSLNAIIYTFSRVKQAISQARILPWSGFFKKDDILQRTHHGSEQDSFLHKSPQGGLIIHWVMTVIVISVSAGTRNTLEAVGLPGYIQTYIHCFVLCILGIGFGSLGSREKSLWPDDADTRRPHRGRFAQLLLGLTVALYVALNLTILIVNPIPPFIASDGSNDTKHAVPGFTYPIVVGGLLIVGTAYYVLFFGAASRRYERQVKDQEQEESPQFGPPQPFAQSGVIDLKSRWNLMRRAGVQCEVRKNYTYDTKVERVYRFGRRWRIVYHLPGDAGYKPPTNPPSKATSAMFLYWLFGGSRLNAAWKPQEWFDKWWTGIKDKVLSLRG